MPTQRSRTTPGTPPDDDGLGAVLGLPSLSLLLVDDHPMWRTTLRQVIERSGVGTVVAEASDGGEAVDKALASKPDVVIMDMILPTMDGIQATKAILTKQPGVKVLVLASSEARATVIAAVRAGASGYLLKTAGAREVADAVRRVVAGDPVFPARLTKIVLDEYRRISEAGAVPDAAIRLLIAGDSVVHRESLAKTLTDQGFEIFGVGADPDTMDASLAEVVILDFHGGTNRADRGLQAANRLRAKHPTLPIVVLAQDWEAASAVALISAGRVGYLLRERVEDLDELVDAIRRVAQGESVLDPSVVSGMVEAPGQKSLLMKLSGREREVLELMAEGHSNPAISQRLFLSGKTVEKHVKSIFTKLGLEDTADYHRRVLAVITYLRSA